MKTFKIILLLVLMTVFTFGIISGLAKLSDDTLEEVEKLRFKYGTLYNLKAVEGWNDIAWDGTIEWNRDYLSIWVEDDKLFVKTQDGKWFIEMTNAHK